MSSVRHSSGGSGFLSRWLASPPPDAALEITPRRVSAASVTSRGGRLIVQSYATEPLAEGVVAAALTGQNVLDPTALTAAVRAVVDRIGRRPVRVALVLPDPVARVSLVRFDQVPARRDDLDQLIRWQVKKAAPFPVEDASVSYSPGGRAADGGVEFLVVAAKRSIIEEYEGACESAGMQAGIVDLATLSVANLFLAGDAVPSGDWMLVHVRPEYTSLVVLRGADVLLFRNRPEGEEGTLADIVHQTAMYYEDRLSGSGFSRVWLGGGSDDDAVIDQTRRRLEERLGVTVESIDPTRIVSLPDRISAGGGLSDVLSPLVGLLLRSQEEAVA